MKGDIRISFFCPTIFFYLSILIKVTIPVIETTIGYINKLLCSLKPLELYFII